MAQTQSGRAPPRKQHHLYGPRLQSEDVTTFMEVSDVEKIDMILESPTSAFKGNFDTSVLRPGNYRVLGTLGMVAITYLYSSGGPIGSEPIVNAGGSLVGLISLVAYPLIMTIPYAMIIAELCSAFPEDGGFTIWVLNAFGPFWAFQVGYWAWVSGVIRSAVIPATILILFFDYYSLPERMSSEWAEYFLKAGMGLAMGLPTLFGTVHVSRLSLLLVMIIVVTFLTYTVWAFTTARDFDDLFEVRHANDTYDEETRDVVPGGDVKIDLDMLVNTLYFKFDGIYMASVCGGEVMNPARTYPRAIFFTVLLMIATYLVPLPASILADDLSWFDFTRDAYPTMAEAIGGSFLKTFILVGSVCASIGQFISGIFIKSFMLSGMAANRLLPISLARRSEKFDAPTYGIVLTTIFASLLAGLKFDDLLSLSNAFAAIVQFMIIVAAMRLRMTLPYIPRPTKVPGGVPGMMMFATIPAVVLGYILLDVFLDSLVAPLIFGGLLVAGIAYGFWSVRWN